MSLTQRHDSNGRPGLILQYSMAPILQLSGNCPVANSTQLLHVGQGMQNRPLVIISTRLPPQICGVGTFSWLLHRHWNEDASPQRFLVVENGARLDPSSRPPVSQFGGDWDALAHALDRSGDVDVLLHYAGRAYHRFGCPTQLSKVLQQWKTKFPTGRLVIFFHELPGRLPLLSKHYWLNICQRRVVRKLANLADLVMTNTQEQINKLENLSRHRGIPCLPIPSNIENAGAPPETRGRTEFVIFGLPYGRWQTLLAFDRVIRDWQQAEILTRLHLIGPTDDKFDQRSEVLLKSYPEPQIVVRHGQIDPEQISRLLSTVQFALTTADELTWAKSSTFMSFLAHRCVPITRSKYGDEPLSFAITPDQVRSMSDTELQAKSDAGRQWYQANADWEILARKVSDLISRVPTHGR